MIRRCFSTSLIRLSRPKMRQRAIVSSFICTPANSPDGFTVAIFKRSQDVSTYRGKWAACSGSIESTDRSPELAARREIREETKLTENDISLLRRGKPFSLVDDELQTEWTIHPFAFVLNDSAKDLNIDWEHTEFRFIKPTELKKYETVPRLEYGLSRVLVSPETERALEMLRNDHESGAGALALHALRELQGIIEGENPNSVTSVEEFWSDLRMVVWHLAKNGRPSMGPAIEGALLKVLETVMAEISNSGSSLQDMHLFPFMVAVSEAIDARIDARSHSLDTIKKLFEDCINTDIKNRPENVNPGNEITILTLSSSSTLVECFTHLIQTAATAKRNIRLLVLESRPLFEGVEFADTLLESLMENPDEFGVLPDVRNRLQIEILPDISAALAMKEAQFLVIGADRISPTGDVSNKIGSSVAAVLAKTLYPDCKVLAVFETDKIAGEADDSEQSIAAEYNDPAEVTGAWPPGRVAALRNKQKAGYRLEVRNPYFEWVPAGYVDRYITEEGVLTAKDIKTLSVKKDELEQRLFRDL